VVHKNLAVTKVSKECATELSDLRRCFDPARRFRIEVHKLLRPLGLSSQAS
jgi:hypothetical protein